MRKIAYLLPGAVLSVGLALAGASAAGASTTLLHGAGNAGVTVSHHARHAAKPAAAANVKPAAVSPIQTFTSSDLAGYIHANASDHRIVDARGVIADLPNLSGCGTACNGDVAQGLTLAQTVNGGDEYGLGAVWNSSDTDVNGNGCTADTYTVQYNSSAYHTTKPEPVPAADLNTVLDAFGSPVCLSPGQGVAAEGYESTGHDTLSWETGPSLAEVSTDAIVHGIGMEFFAAGFGISTALGGTNAAGDIPSGTVFSFGPLGLTQDQHNFPGASAERITFANGSIYEVEGTVSGGPVTPGNVATLIPGQDSAGSAFPVTVQ
jgi:hypothetical protein